MATTSLPCARSRGPMRASAEPVAALVGGVGRVLRHRADGVVVLHRRVGVVDEDAVPRVRLQLGGHVGGPADLVVAVADVGGPQVVVVVEGEALAARVAAGTTRGGRRPAGWRCRCRRCRTRRPCIELRFLIHQHRDARVGGLQRTQPVLLPLVQDDDVGAAGRAREVGVVGGRCRSRCAPGRPPAWRPRRRQRQRGDSHDEQRLDPPDHLWNTPFGSPAGLEGPVTLRPRLATGLPLSMRRSPNFRLKRGDRSSGGRT